MFQATMPTLKLLPVPIRLPFFRVDVSAARASLTGIGRRNKHNRNTSYCSFVSYKNYELVERPVVRSSPLSFVSRFGIKAFPNSGQVLKCQRRTRLFCLLYQLLADVVIHPFLEPALSARKPSHQATCRTSAFGLNVSPDLAKSVTNRLNLTPIPGFSPRSSGNVAASEIDPNHLGCFACRWRVNLKSTRPHLRVTPTTCSASMYRNVRTSRLMEVDLNLWICLTALALPITRRIA